MKQKLFTLLTLLLVGISSAWADGKVVKLFHWQTNATAPELSTAMSASKGGLPSVGTAIWEGEGAPGTEGVTYNASVTDTDLKGTTGTKALKLGKSNLSMKITLRGDVKLQEGDVISVCGYNPFNIGSTEDGNHKAGTEIASALATGTGKSDYNIGTVTVTAAMITAIGSNVNALYFSRAEGSGTGLAAIKITRTITAPLITTQPVSAEYAVGEDATALTVAAIASTGDLTYQWYKNTDGDTSAKVADKIDGAESATLAAANISTASAGTYYYYCVVGDGSANKSTSAKATITVNQTYTVTYKANGSGESDVKDDAATTVAANPFTYAGHVFTGWNTAAGGGGTAYAVGDAVTDNLTLFAQWAEVYAITKGTHTNGDFTIDPASATAGETVTLTATPNFKYVLDSWSVYKTGEPGTTVTVTDNQFTMPAYAVTVDATFSADARKQILYLTSNSESDTKASDKLYAALNSVDDYNVIIAAPASQTLTNYDLIVLHESIGGTSDATAVTGCKTTTTPVLNTKSYFYGADGDASKRWQWGAPNAGKSVKGATLNTAITNIASHPLFSGVDITDNAFDIVGSAAAKTMQPVGSFVSGKEGYILATTPNATYGSGAAIQEMTSAQRGGLAGKYLMISVSSSQLNSLNTNGQKLFQNAAAYLLGATTFTPTGSVTTNAGKWASYTPGYNTTLESGATAYIITGVEGSTITASAVSVLKAGTGYFIKGESASTAYAATVSASEGTATTGNMIVGSFGSMTISNAKIGSENNAYDKYVLGTATSGANTGKSGLFLVGSANVTIGAGKAFLLTTTTGGAHSLTLDFEDGAATGILTIDAKKELLEGDFYNLKGQKVAQPTKGLYIVNGRKVIIK